MRIRSFLLAAALFSPIAGNTQATRTAQDSITGSKRAVATRVNNGTINVDGKLDESAWATIPPIEDFVQKDPVEGGIPSDKLSVRFAYDEDALYVGIRVITKPGRAVQSPIGRRDNIDQSEYVAISLDSYRDRRTAYTFTVTASGVRGDFYHANDSEGSMDPAFEPVWNAATSSDAQGWTAEMRIPFSQVRFNAGNLQLWGLNVIHFIPNLNESVYWVAVPKRGTGWSSWMGSLEGISGIVPSRRLELMPYIATDSKVTGNRDTRNPFDDGRNLGARVGGDLKMGLGPALTLQATINPDFGQVEADPAEVNLSAFETFFSEKRPFFVEGANLFQGGHNYFYSRRIGAKPRGPASGSYVDYPNASTILGAAKLTGRLPNGASLAGLAAVTDRESAQIYDTATKKFGKVLVAPLTTYSVGRVQQEFGKNKSTAGFMLAAVDRNIHAGDPFEKLLNKQAYSGGGDWNLRFKQGMYVIQGAAGFSHVQGDSNAISLAQRSSVRYWQRPDAKAYHFDPSRTSFNGYQTSLTLAKNSGKHWIGGFQVSEESPGFEINDAGRIGTADGIVGVGQFRYRETQPNKYLRNYGVTLSPVAEWNYDHDMQYGEYRVDADATFRNFWGITLTGWHDLRAQDERLTRGGPSMGYGFYNVGIVNLFNSSASRTRWNARLYYGKDEFGSPTNRISGSLAMRPSPRWSFSAAPNYLRAVSSRQFITSLSGGTAATYGRRYVFSFIDQSQLFAELRLNYTLKPDVTLEVYGQPFAASGRFYDFGELDAARSRNLRPYGQDGTTIVQQTNGRYLVTDTKRLTSGAPTTFTLPNPDFNVRSFRSNMVLRWEYRPGSTLYLVWQEDRSGSEAQGALVQLNDLFGAFQNAGNNYFAIKASFWIPAK